MKKIDIPISLIISIFLGVISLYLFFHNSMEIIYYKYSTDLLELSEKNIEIDKYVKGTISDCFTILINENKNTKKGSSGEWIKAGVVAVGVGGELTAPAKKGDYAKVTENAKEFVAAVKQARGE